MTKRVLIVEDESDIADALAVRLRSEGFTVSVADNGTDGLDMALHEGYDIAILDIMLPGIDGLSIATQLRDSRETNNTAILLLSARDGEDDIITGLDEGADDYVTKPFSAREVVARVHALIRRQEFSHKLVAAAHDVYTFGDLIINGITHSVSLKGDFIHTTPTEFRLISVLCSQPSTVFSREELVELLSHDEHDDHIISHSNLRTVDSHIRSLRKKIGAHYIRTIHAVGYAFEQQPSEQVSA